MTSRRILTTALTLTAAPAVLAACTAGPASARITPAANAASTANHSAGNHSAGNHSAAIPRFSHIVVVIEENHSYSQIIGSSSAPYINSLASQGASFTNSHAITHPSEPNYLALFAGSTFGLTGDDCPRSFPDANLGSEALAAQLSYDSYSESMPSPGFTGCTSGEYARKHNPAADFTNLPSSVNETFDQFPSSFDSLPTISFVDPNLLDDMHSASVSQGDSWLQDHMDGYITWAKANNSLLILTWDENDGSAGNQIPTIFVGAHVIPGQYSTDIDHYSVLRTIEDAYGLPYAGASASAAPITSVFSG